MNHLNGHNHGLNLELKNVKYICRLCGGQFFNGSHFGGKNHRCCSILTEKVEEEEEETEDCLYCHRQVRVGERASHRSLHKRLDFECEVGTCTRQASFWDTFHSGC